MKLVDLFCYKINTVSSVHSLTKKIKQKDAVAEIILVSSILVKNQVTVDEN